MALRKRKTKGRSKLGCATCRQRRIKCDEQKPRCHNCVTASFSCEGAPTARFAGSRGVNGSWPHHCVSVNQPLPWRRSSEAERRSFEFYVSHAQHNARDIADRRFWLIFLPRLAMFDDAVYYALLTLAHLTEHPTRSGKPLTPVSDIELGTVRHVPALTWYNHSLRIMYAGQAKSPSVNCLGCILYARFEMLQGRGLKGLEWLRRAFALNQGDDQTSEMEAEILDATLPVLAKAMLPIATFGHRLPWDQRRRIVRRKGNILPQNLAEESTLLDFMIDLYDLVYQVQVLCNHDATTSHHRKERAAVIGRLLEWKAAADRAKRPHMTGHARQFLAYLFVLYHTQYIRLCCTPVTKETVYDPFEADFSAIVVEARRALCAWSKPASETTYDMAIVPCLYFTAWASRQQQIRWQALQLLRTWAPRCEHLWTMPGTAGVLEELVAYEEALGAAKASGMSGWSTDQGRVPVPESVARSQVPAEVVLAQMRDRVKT